MFIKLTRQRFAVNNNICQIKWCTDTVCQVIVKEPVDNEIVLTFQGGACSFRITCTRTSYKISFNQQFFAFCRVTY